MRTAPLLLVAFFLAACDSDEEPAPSPETPADEAPATPSEPETPVEEPAPGEPANEDPPTAADLPSPAVELNRPQITAAQRRSLQQAIKAGRRAARQGDHATADARFREAVEIDPFGSRTRCEAGYVAFRAGDVERARQWIDKALASMPANPPESIRVPRAMCLYNAGLVYQAQGRTEDARTAWTQSLDLRPNATVQTRLDGLGDPQAAQAEGELSLDASAGFGAHRDLIRDYWCASGSDGFTPEDIESCTAISVSHRSPEGTAAGLEAEIVELAVDSWGVSQAVFLVVRAAGAVRAYRLADIYNPGVGGVSADYRVDARYEDLLRGGVTELRLDVRHGTNDEDMGVCERNGYSAASTIVCSADGGELRCAAIQTLSDAYFEHEPCEDWDTGEMEDESAAVEEHEGYMVTAEIANGTLTVTDADTGIGTPPRELLGTHPLASVLAPGSDWILEPL